ncbi:MAG: nicotinate phosphoribosyltransferase [Deltaproteobacteria bacterium]
MANLIPSSLLVDLYELTMAESYFRHRFKAQATFELFVRKLPPARSYFLFAGLEDILRYLKNFKFTQEDLVFLERLGFGQEFLTYLGKMRFHGDVWAMPEGAVFFPNEPVLRLTGSLIETQMVESFLLNTVNLATMVATKASRIVAAAGARGVYDFSLRRTHGMDASLKAARSAYIAGCRGTSNVLAAKLYGIPAVGTMAHSYIMSFSKEKEAFQAFFEAFPDRCILLVDTYDTLEGVRNAIQVAREFRSKGHELQGIRLDSGDIVALARAARRMLDAAGFRKVKIMASGDLDEYKIERFIKDKAPVDNFGVGTQMGASVDAPTLDVIYKIAEVTHEEGVFVPTMKFSEEKVTLPGRKQVFRVKDKAGRYERDIIGLEDEGGGEPLLQMVMHAGEVIYSPRPLKDVQAQAMKNVASLRMAHRRLDAAKPYPVTLSPGLSRLVRRLSRDLKKSRGAA